MKYLIAVIIITISLIGCAPTLTSQIKEVKYRCDMKEDCTSTCGMGCVSQEWAKTYKDTCVNIRAYDCTCPNNQCYTDGNPPKK